MPVLLNILVTDHLPNIAIPQEETGLEKEQIVVLRRAFDSFDRDKKGYISPDTVGDILRMMGIKVSSTSLKAIIEEIDEDGQ